MCPPPVVGRVKYSPNLIKIGYHPIKSSPNKPIWSILAKISSNTRFIDIGRQSCPQL